MATTPSADIARVRRLLRDEDVDEKLLPDDNIDDAVQAAVERYSQVFPNLTVKDVTGNGTRFYDMSGWTGWVNDWSSVKGIEYPAAAVSSTHVPEFLDPVSDWQTYRDTSKTYLWLPNHQPAATETIRVTYTVPRLLTSSSDTIVSEHKDAVLALAAAYACDILAAHMSSTSAPMVQANTADWQSAQRRYYDVARSFEKRFNQRFGIGEPSQVRSAGIRRDWETRGVNRGERPYLTHWGRG